MIPRNINETKANSKIISLFKQYISAINLKKCILINSIISSRAKPSSSTQEEGKCNLYLYNSSDFNQVQLSYRY